MRKKLFYSSLLAILVAGVFGTAALAWQGEAGPDAPTASHRPRGVRGEITGINLEGRTFELLTNSGETLTLKVTAETHYWGQVEAFEDLAVGMQVGVGVKPDPETGPLALHILVHDQIDRLGRVRGKISGVDLPSGSFQLAVPRRGEITILTDDTTRYRGAASSLEDLVINQAAQVTFVRLEDESLRAVLVIVPERQPVQRFMGRVHSVDAGAGLFTLENRQGDLLDLAVDENTNFRSPEGEINGLDDLQVDMPVAAGVVPQSDGQYLAKWVAATNRPLPRVPIRVRGEILAIGEGKFTLETPGGDTLDFLVTENTIYRGPRGRLDGLGSLETGMRIGVGAEETGDGFFQANLVLIGR